MDPSLAPYIFLVILIFLLFVIGAIYFEIKKPCNSDDSEDTSTMKWLMGMGILSCVLSFMITLLIIRLTEPQFKIFEIVYNSLFGVVIISSICSAFLGSFLYIKIQTLKKSLCLPTTKEIMLGSLAWSFSVFIPTVILSVLLKILFKI